MFDGKATKEIGDVLPLSNDTVKRRKMFEISGNMKEQLISALKRSAGIYFLQSDEITDIADITNFSIKAFPLKKQMKFFMLLLKRTCVHVLSQC